MEASNGIFHKWWVLFPILDISEKELIRGKKVGISYLGACEVARSLTQLLFLKLPFVLQPLGFGVQLVFTIQNFSLVGRLINASNQSPKTEVVEGSGSINTASTQLLTQRTLTSNFKVCQG